MLRPSHNSLGRRSRSGRLVCVLVARRRVLTEAAAAWFQGSPRPEHGTTDRIGRAPIRTPGAIMLKVLPAKCARRSRTPATSGLAPDREPPAWIASLNFGRNRVTNFRNYLFPSISSAYRQIPKSDGSFSEVDLPK